MGTRINGTLKTWNEAQGFGFITPLNGGQDIFVHISDYPRRGGQPKIGEPISFAVALNKDGKKKAVEVERPGGESTARYKAGSRLPAGQGNSFFSRLVGVVFFSMMILAGYKFIAPKFNASSSEPAMEASIAAPANAPAPAFASAPAVNILAPVTTPAPVAAARRFTCDGRTHCSHMTSCEEATYFIRNCPNTKMDGNGDGVPCESQWCTSPFAK